jgi:hypothetical protein
MQMMVHCRHHIGANSAFSRWALRLNQSHEKIGAALWVGSSGNDTRDPRGWAQL